MKFNPKWIIGKTVASVDMRPFSKGKIAESRMGLAHDPLITFTDGSAIIFTTEETEVGEYGTSIGYRKPRSKVQYKTIDTSTLDGLRQAERLHTSGWEIVRSGLFTIQFYRKERSR